MNVIVIVADSLRADHVGCYGSEVQTPNIDALAAESAVLENAYAENLPTFPCRTAWWTGQFHFPSRGWTPLKESDVTLSETLYSSGFRSALVTDTYHFHKPGFNPGRGFDTTVFLRGQEYDPWVVDDAPVDLSKTHRLRGNEGDAHWRACFEQYMKNRTRFATEEDHCAPRTFQAAMDWLERRPEPGDDPFFLWIDSFSPHEPWDPPEPYRSMYDPDFDGFEIMDPVPGPVRDYMSDDEVRHTHALYCGVVTLVDKWVGKLLEKVRALGLWDDTLIMFTSDHGEPFAEHGIIRKAGAWNHEYLARIPWIIRHPDGLGAGERFDAFAQPPDLMPTLYDALGVTTDQLVQGTSVLPVLRGETEGIRDFAVTAWHERQWAIRDQDWAFFLDVVVGEPNALYDRRQDRAERHNLLGAHPDVAEALELKLRRFAHEVEHERKEWACASKP